MDMYTFAPSILLVKSDSQIFMLAIVGSIRSSYVKNYRPTVLVAEKGLCLQGCVAFHLLGEINRICDQKFVAQTRMLPFGYLMGVNGGSMVI